jgi:hypothetical protein
VVAEATQKKEREIYVDGDNVWSYCCGIIGILQLGGCYFPVLGCVAAMEAPGQLRRMGILVNATTTPYKSRSVEQNETHPVANFPSSVKALHVLSNESWDSVMLESQDEISDRLFPVIVFREVILGDTNS